MTDHPIITITTDFGDEGSYVGAMKGVILSQCPSATLVDITHHIPPFSFLEASLVLDQACRRFPANTVHLAVVDPGVGGLRKPIIVRSGDQFFVGPDNGIFTPFLVEEAAVYRIAETVALPGSSATFHGRDLFAPAAARLASGEAPETLGEPTRQASRLHVPRPRGNGPTVEGQVLYADHFGNLVTNIRDEDLRHLGAEVEVMVGTQRIRRIARTYQDGAMGQPLALVGSSGFLEVAVVEGRAGAQLGVGKGERVRVRVVNAT